MGRVHSADQQVDEDGEQKAAPKQFGDHVRTEEFEHVVSFVKVRLEVCDGVLPVRLGVFPRVGEAVSAKALLEKGCEPIAESGIQFPKSGIDEARKRTRVTRLGAAQRVPDVGELFV